MKNLRLWLTLLAAFVLMITGFYVNHHLLAASGDVTELAPGVFFREQSQGCNNGWVIFKDYVLVIDANFPEHAPSVVKAIRETTDKPIRFVFDTHYHGDHAFGNAIYTADGAVAVATDKCLEEMIEKGHPAFEAGKKEREDFANSYLQDPTVLFEKKVIFDDGEHRVELLHFGQAHTRGDAVAYLPKEKILFTGDACVNGAFNYTGDGDTANWIRVLDSMKQLDVELVAPGHGKPRGTELFDLQRRWFVELRAAVGKGIDDGRSLEAIKATLDIPFYEQWTGVPARERTENIEHVYGELTQEG